MESEISAVLNSVNMSYPDAAKRDILNALSAFCDLYPGTDFYVFNDGSSRKMVTLNGTIPINYKGNTYHIPLCLYLSDTHPYAAPMCYVRPTQDMMIRNSQHVDSSGKIFVPYLREWRYPQSDLLGLLQVLAIDFGEHCPVFSKPSVLSTSGVPSGGAQTTHSVSVGSSSTSFSPHTPARPVPPFTSSYFPQNTTSATTTALSPYTGFGAASSHYPVPMQGMPVSAQPEHARFNLFMAIEEKLRAKLNDSMGTSHAELHSVRKTREDLISGEKKLASMLNKMKDEQEYVDSTVAALNHAIMDLDKRLTDAGHGEEEKIDDAVDTTAPLFRQLLNAYAEDNAVEDTLYYLGEGLKKGRIDLENYLKHVRILSRQQFVMRATMQRCRRVAGLPC